MQGVSFNVLEGEILALLGHNGAGKTSTLHSIAQLASPKLQLGESWLDHQALHKMTNIRLRPWVYLWYEKTRAYSQDSSLKKIINSPKSVSLSAGDWIKFMICFRVLEYSVSKRTSLFQEGSSGCFQSRELWYTTLNYCCLINPMRVSRQ